jgi:hypothetical protein
MSYRVAVAVALSALALSACERTSVMAVPFVPPIVLINPLSGGAVDAAGPLAGAAAGGSGAMIAPDAPANPPATTRNGSIRHEQGRMGGPAIVEIPPLAPQR